MATDIKVPTLGESVSEATVAQWLKKVGDAVDADEPVVELETDKVTLEVNAPEAGTLEEITAEEGDNVEVGALLGRVGEGDGKAKGDSGGKAEAEEEEEEAAEAEEEEPEAEEEEEEEEEEEAAASGGETVEIEVPTLGESVSEATVAQWLKAEGDSVAADEPVLELETDKVTLEVNAPAAGTLAEQKVKEGDTVEVGAILGSVAKGGAPKKAKKAKKAEKEAPKKAAAKEAKKPAEKAEAPKEKPAEKGGRKPTGDLDPSKAPRGDGGKIGRDELLRFLEESTPPSAMTLSPAVENMIREHGLDPNEIEGTGPKGRITKDDVIAFVESGGEKAKAPAEAKQQAPAAGKAETGEREERKKMSKLRQTIARRLKEAQNTAAMLTTFNEADMGAIMDLRGQYKESFEKKHGVKLGFMSFFVKASVAALKELPAVNAEIDGEEIVYKYHYDIGVAVSTPQGLMVPVVRDADAKSFAEIEAEIVDLGKRARDGKLKLEEMQGGTFSITNGGIFGSLVSTPILNMPQGAILGMHKIQERPMAVNGEVKIRPMMYLALSYDHRLIDGREAVTFLVRLKENLEDPQRLLIGM